MKEIEAVLYGLDFVFFSIESIEMKRRKTIPFLTGSFFV